MGDVQKDVQTFKEMIAPNSGKLTIPNVFLNHLLVTPIPVIITWPLLLGEKCAHAYEPGLKNMENTAKAIFLVTFQTPSSSSNVTDHMSRIRKNLLCPLGASHAVEEGNSQKYKP